MSAKVRVENLYKIFGKSPQEAINRLQEGASKEDILSETGHVVGMADVSFSVGEGEVFMVMGLSGSGKSTLIRCINRLITPTAGNVYVDDEEISRLAYKRLKEIRRTKLAMVFQHFGLFPHRTVAQNVEYGLKVRGMPRKERQAKALETLEMVGLTGWENRYPGDLSGGMQQRVGLARGLATDPEVLLMDEPFSALDPLIRREMQDELLQLQRTVKKTIIFITHDLSEALKMGDHVAIMKDGRIVQLGTPEDIVDNPADDYVTAFTQDVDRGRVITVGSVMRRPEALRLDRDQVRAAMFRMRELGRDGLFVVDQQNKPVGLVIDQDIATAALNNQHDLGKIMRREFPQTSTEAPLAEIYSSAATGLPIAVLNDDGRMVGFITQFDILANVASFVEPGDKDSGKTVSGDTNGIPDETMEGRVSQSFEVDK